MQNLWRGNINNHIYVGESSENQIPHRYFQQPSFTPENGNIRINYDYQRISWFCYHFKFETLINIILSFKIETKTT